MVFDLVWLGILAWIALRVAAEGAWGSVLVFLCVLLGGLFAMNAFEPLAELLEQRITAEEAWSFRWDLISLLGLFSLAVFVLRMLTERLAPASMPLPGLFEFAIRWIAGAATGYLTVAILLTALHVAPLPRVVTGEEVLEPLGFQAERQQMFGVAPDRQWLSFNHWISQQGLNRGSSQRIFDGPIYYSGGERGRWPTFPLRYADRRERMTRLRMPPDTAGE